MSFSVYDGLYAYARRANSGLYLGCRTAIFNDPSNQIYTMKGKVTKVRQYESGKAGTYDKTKGWTQNYGTSKGVEWKDYIAPYDRAKNLMVDAIDELQSYANGMEPSIDLLNEDFFNNFLPSEIDATNIAQFYSKIPYKNKFGPNQMDTSVDGIINTIISLQNKMFNSGYNGKTVLFMRSSVYANFQTAIVKNYGLASNAILTKTMSVNVDTGLGDVLGSDKATLSFDSQVTMFNNFIIVNMPDDRMYSAITMYDGYSSGQEAGGYVTTDVQSTQIIDMMAIPMSAAFTNVRYLVDNYLVPSTFVTGSNRNEMNKLNGLLADRAAMFGNIMIGQAGINQKANAFEYDVRIIYGGDIFDNRARNCFAVTGLVPATSFELTLDGKTNLEDPVLNTKGQVGSIGVKASTKKPKYASVDAGHLVDCNIIEGNEHAKLNKLNDGSYTLTAVSNGTVRIEAADFGGVYVTLTVTISGQD